MGGHEIKSFTNHIASTIYEYAFFGPYSLYLIITFMWIWLLMTGLEFIAAQSPYAMRGMLIGTFYCIRGVYGFIITFIIVLFTILYKSQSEYIPHHLGHVSCGVPLLGVIIIVAVLGLVGFIAISWKHKYRERDELFDTRKYAENYYSKHSSHNNYYK